MNKSVLTIALLGCISASHASEELAASNNCLACHKADAQLVGPSFQDIAAKNKGVDGAADLLFESVKNGSSGNWGDIPMPPNAAASDEDIKALVQWILAM